MGVHQHRDSIIQALYEEISAVKNDRNKDYSLYDGELIATVGEEHLYVFKAEDELKAPGDTPAVLRIGQEDIPVTVINVEGFDVHVASLIRLDKRYDISRARLHIDLTFILQTLIERLQDASVWKGGALQAIFRTAPSQVKALGQERAVAAVANENGVFIWGPPGTGKTTTIGSIAIDRLRGEERVLILSHTNVAVDAATDKISSQLDPGLLQAGVLVRVGVPVVPEVRENAFVSPIRIAERTAPQLKVRRRALETRRQELAKQIRQLERSAVQKKEKVRVLRHELVDVKRDLSSVIEELREAELAIISQARIVAATLSKSVLSPEMLGVFDVVIVDEASMAYIPQVIYASSFSARCLVVIGDFRQLPPISQASTPKAKQWLQRDVFDEAGIITAVNDRKPDKRLVTLDVQHRMHPKISAICNILAYNLMLKDAPGLARSRESIARVTPPLQGQTVVAIDYGELWPYARKTRQGSHYNPITAAIMVGLAADALRAQVNNATVGIITPYIAQARLIRRLLWDLDLDRDIEVSTVHRFQGHERDIIIIDLVDTTPQRCPGVLLSGGFGTEGMRLINVAVSRSRAKLIVACDRKFFRERTSAGSSVKQLLNYLDEKSGFQRVPVSSTIEVCVMRDWERILRELKAAIGRATKVWMALKGTETHFGPVWTKLESVSIPVDALLRNPEPAMLFRAAQAGATVRTVPFVAAPVVLLNDDDVWLFSKNDQRFCVRVKGKRFAQGVVAELGAGATVPTLNSTPAGQSAAISSSSTILTPEICPECSTPMQLRPNKQKTSLFWGCTQYPRCHGSLPLSETSLAELDVILAEQGHRCPICASPLCSKKKFNKIFFGCSAFPGCNGSRSVRDLF